MSSYNTEKLVAVEAVISAMKLCEKVRNTKKSNSSNGDDTSGTTMEKIDKSPVTIADYGSQALICKSISEAFPDDPIVAEEDATDFSNCPKSSDMAKNLSKITNFVLEQLQPQIADEQDNSTTNTTYSEDHVINWINRGNGMVTPTGRYWTLDPIDGTKGFLRQNGQYAVALALIENGDVKVGVLGCPAFQVEDANANEEKRQTSGALFVAVRGEGTTMMAPVVVDDVITCNTANIDSFVPVKVGSTSTALVESVESSHGDQQRQETIAKAVGITLHIRADSQVKYGIVALGQASLYLRLPPSHSPDHKENIWDHAAGVIVVEEAGGRVTDMFGKPLDFKDKSAKTSNNCGVVVSNGVIHDQVLSTLAMDST